MAPGSGEEDYRREPGWRTKREAPEADVPLPAPEAGPPGTGPGMWAGLSESDGPPVGETALTVVHCQTSAPLGKLEDHSESFRRSGLRQAGHRKASTEVSSFDVAAAPFWWSACGEEGSMVVPGLAVPWPGPGKGVTPSPGQEAAPCRSPYPGEQAKTAGRSRKTQA